jgi:hypothetical protein
MAVPVVLVAMVMTVMNQRTEHDQGRERRHVVDSVVSLRRGAGHCQREQAGKRDDSKFVYPLFNHYYLRHCLIMATI